MWQTELGAKSPGRTLSVPLLKWGVAGWAGAWEALLHWQFESGAGAAWRGPPLEQQCKAREEERWGGCAARTLPFPRPATLQNSIKKFEQELMLERHLTLMKEKQVIVRRQQEEVSRLMQTQVGDLHHQVDKQTHDRWAEATARKGALGLRERAGGLRHLWPWVRQVTTSCIFQSQALFAVLSYFSGPVRTWSAVIRTASPSFMGKTVLLGPLPGVLLLLRAHWVPSGTAHVL